THKANHLLVVSGVLAYCQDALKIGGGQQRRRLFFVTLSETFAECNHFLHIFVLVIKGKYLNTISSSVLWFRVFFLQSHRWFLKSRLFKDLTFLPYPIGYNLAPSHCPQAPGPVSNF